MADLTLCFRDTCPMASTCLRSRFVTPPGFRQEWRNFGPPVDGWCESYLSPIPADASLEADRQFLEAM